jgi:porin
MMTSSWRWPALVGVFVALALPVAAEEGGSSSDDPPPPAGESQPGDGPTFGGPNAVENQLHEDQQAGGPLFDRIADWKSWLKDKRGIDLGLDYSAAYFSASDSPGDDQSASGMLRFFGSWDLVGRGKKNTGAFVWKVEHRHGYTDVPLFDFGFELGYAGFIAPPFSDAGLLLTNLYWRQRWREKRAITAVGGWVDATDYVDVYALASPWTGFTNFSFSTGSNTIPVPNQGLGAAASAMLTKQLFVIGGLADSNSDPGDPIDGFDTFFNDREYFKHIEFGWTPSLDRLYLDNLHVTFWHADEREEAGTPSGWGANFSFTRYLGERWLPFVRGGWADDGGSVLQKSLSVGFGYQPVPGKNLLGVGLNWGEPNESTFAPGLDDQYTAEVFYRWNVSREIALTPDLQYLKNPALNPDQDSIWVFGLRARFAL